MRSFQRWVEYREFLMRQKKGALFYKKKTTTIILLVMIKNKMASHSHGKGTFPRGALYVDILLLGSLRASTSGKDNGSAVPKGNF